MRGRTNIPPRPTAIVNGTPTDFIVAKNEVIEVGDFVEFERTSGYQAIDNVIMNHVVHADVSDTLKVVSYTTVYSTTYNFKVSLIDVSTGTAKILDTYTFVRTKAQNSGGTTYEIRSTSVLVLDDGTIICGTSSVYTGDPLVVRLKVVDNKLVEAEKYIAQYTINGVDNGSLVKLSNNRFVLVCGLKMVLFTYTTSALTYVREIVIPYLNKYVTAFCGCTSDGRIIMLTYNGSDEEYRWHHYFEMIKLDTSNNVSLLGYVDTGWSNSSSSGYAYKVHYAKPLADDGVIVFTRQNTLSSAVKTHTMLSITFDTTNIYIGTTTTIKDVFKDVYPTVTSLTEEYFRMYRISANTFVTAVRTGSLYMYGIVNVDNTSFSLLTNVVTFAYQANISTYPITDIIAFHYDDYLYVIGRGYIDSSETLNQLKFKHTAGDNYIEVGEDTVYVKKYKGGKSLGFAKTGGTSGEMIKVYVPIV